MPTSMETFDGSSDENWFGDASARRIGISLSHPAVHIPTNTIANAFCDHYIAKSADDTYTDNPGYYQGSCFSITNPYVQFSNGAGHDIVVADFKTWLSTHPVTVLYPLATPITESLGYIDLPDIPAGSTVSIPELDALGISYYVDNGAEQYKARLEATSFSDIEDAITELAAEVQQNTNRTQLYFGYDTVNGKQMISVFKRNV